MFLLYIPRRINNHVDLKNCYIWYLLNIKYIKESNKYLKKYNNKIILVSKIQLFHFQVILEKTRYINI